MAVSAFLGDSIDDSRWPQHAGWGGECPPHHKGGFWLFLSLWDSGQKCSKTVNISPYREITISRLKAENVLCMAFIPDAAHGSPQGARPEAAAHKGRPHGGPRARLGREGSWALCPHRLRWRVSDTWPPLGWVDFLLGYSFGLAPAQHRYLGWWGLERGREVCRVAFSRHLPPWQLVALK